MKLKRKFWWAYAPHLNDGTLNPFFSRDYSAGMVRVEVRLAPKRRKKPC